MVTEFKQKLEKTREYLSYLEKHYDNVQAAWEVIQEALKKEPCVWDDFRFFCIKDAIKEHDLSKLSAAEFVPYRKMFYPTNLEASEKELNKREFQIAWEHHWGSNDHHWENWMASAQNGQPYFAELACAQMICDWVAMSMAFGEVSPRKYYEKRKKQMNLPKWAEVDIYTVCDYMEKEGA